MAERIGQQVGNYRLIRLLGQGGFAEVYLGEHLRLNSYAAIKVLFSRIAREDLQNFQREAQIIASLHHPHIITVFDFDVQHGIPFLVMDYAPNGSLRQKHPRGSRLPVALVAAYTRQICDALQFAHDQRLVHRDLKPENILIGRRGELLLSDFGIASMMQSSSAPGPRTIAGSILYMAPEQLQGNPRAASDQYALAVIVYEWLCGTRPFSGTTIEIATQHLFASPRPLRSFNPALSPQVEYVVLKALAKDHRQRFPSVRAFAQALEQASQGAGNVEHISGLEQPPALQTGPYRAVNPSLLTSQEIITPPHTVSEPIRYSPEIDAAYEKLRKESKPLQNLKGALVARATESQVGLTAYALEEAYWLRYPGHRANHAQTAQVQKYTVNGRNIPAAIFFDLFEDKYLVWIDEQKPVAVSIRQRKTHLIDLR